MSAGRTSSVASARIVLTVLRKELLDISRDRRALFAMIVLPVLLYPLIMVGFTYASMVLVRTLEKKTSTVWVHDLANQPVALRARLADPKHRMSIVAEPASVTSADLERALADGQVQAIVRPRQPLDQALADLTTQTVVEIVYNAGLDASAQARHKVLDALAEWEREIVDGRLRERNMSRAFGDPVRPETVDLAPKGAFLGRMLAFILVISSLMGAFYPALDLGAGEKERGTLETLLLAPASRFELAAGKFGAVFCVALTNAVLNIASLGLTFQHFGSLAGGGEAADRLGSVAIGPAIIVSMLAILLPLVALFSALALAISTLATSYKEGTSYLQPLAISASLLSAAAALPGVELSTPLCFLPVAGAAILFREMLGGTAHLGHALLVLGSSLAYAGLAVRWVGSLYEREEVLTRPAAAAGLNLSRAAAPLAPGDPLVPSLPQALFAAALGLMLCWFGGQKLQQPPHMILGLIATLLFLIAAPPVVYAKALGLDLAATFRIRPPPGLALVAAVLVAIGGQILAHDIAALQAHFTGEPLPQEQAAWARLLGDVFGRGRFFALAVFALLPAVCEETLFRGFVLTGLRRDSGPVLAAVLSGILFGITHLDPGRLGAVSLLGILLAALVLRSGSLLPAMLCHFVHNGLALAIVARSAELEAHGLFADGRPTWLARGIALACVAGGLGALAACPRPDRDRD